MLNLNPLKNDGNALPLTVPLSYRAWAHWSSVVGVGCLQVATLRQTFEGRSEPPEMQQLQDALCEVYSRAIFEVSIGLHFDRVDTRSDVCVLQLICELFDWGLAQYTHERVSKTGPVVRDWSAMLTLLLVAEAPTDPR